MSTRLIYQSDSYLKNLLTRVVEKDVEKNAILLESTIYYPGGGGQPPDNGWICRQMEVLMSTTPGKLGTSALWNIKARVRSIKD